ncbi:MAG: hypothetical protein A3G49_01095 [Candidatus Sungbacteria bacterium RIFCSPLOWO2_12_FULL_41_11]|uniref:Uncharacterized protein n=1 Tax=Candidatus Sungbacteria bacterium RIFCSPLOWO2_12_FULL_41_11 TaxID=1802286 RepID=A0A1G2LP66_9BACT|nr:MAG: hypothetical protein UV01_C0006G0047 [Parcubacteria group bacterium GW2011_GWA2_42_14]OGZ97420.1 MAG: hypothetical protein A3D41_05645 [Candidatus Sungbacteria bacterium RIFCSPHIGHO2_02_FULL_41_12b]OHA13420.1 MAG: hypothetical protein A3G49_01095 [Candidatus Sungbacteria bacterium RIFCSPLOWO2_12_FULL_41_11]
MQEILKMVIEPYLMHPPGWKLHWLPVLGTTETMNKPISIDSEHFHNAISILRGQLPYRGIGTASGEMYMFLDKGMTPDDAQRIHEFIQGAYWLTLKETHSSYALEVSLKTLASQK